MHVRNINGSDILETPVLQRAGGREAPLVEVYQLIDAHKVETWSWELHDGVGHCGQLEDMRQGLNPFNRRPLRPTTHGGRTRKRAIVYSAHPREQRVAARTSASARLAGGDYASVAPLSRLTRDKHSMHAECASLSSTGGRPQCGLPDVYLWMRVRVADVSRS